MPISSKEGLLEFLGRWSEEVSDGDINDAIKYINNAPISDLNYQDQEYGMTALMWSISFNNFQIIEALIKRGVDVNLQDNLGNTVLMSRVEVRILKLLMDLGANIDLKNIKGETALDRHSHDDQKIAVLIGVDHPFTQSDILYKYPDLLDQKGVCYGLNVEITRWVMKHIAKGEPEDQIDVISKLQRVVQPTKDTKNFIMRLAIYQLMQDDISQNLTIPYKENNFFDSLPDEMKNKKFIGMGFDTFRNGKRGSHTISIRRIGGSESYEVIDVNLGSKRCNSTDDLNKYIANILKNYKVPEGSGSPVLYMYDLEKKVEELGLLSDPILDSYTLEEKEGVIQNNKAKKYKLSDDIILRAVSGESVSVALIKELINRGGNIDYSDQYGMTPLNFAIKHDNSNDNRVINLLLENGAKVNINHLRYAISKNRLDLVGVLLEKGANVIDESNNLYLNSALTKDIRIINRLINAGWNVNARDNLGKTPLIIASSNTNIDNRVTELLLAKGADITLRDSSGDSALDYARRNNNSAVVTLLEKAALEKDVLTASNFISKVDHVSDDLPKIPPSSPLLPPSPPSLKKSGGNAI